MSPPMAVEVADAGSCIVRIRNLRLPCKTVATTEAIAIAQAEGACRITMPTHRSHIVDEVRGSLGILVGNVNSQSPTPTTLPRRNRC